MVSTGIYSKIRRLRIKSAVFCVLNVMNANTDVLAVVAEGLAENGKATYVGRII